MKQQVVVFGASAFAEMVAVYLATDRSHEVVAFTVEQPYIRENKFLGLPLIPFELIELKYPPDKFQMFVAVGHAGFNAVRTRIYNEGKAKGYRFISYVSSKAIHWGVVSMGENCFICECSVIQPGVSMGQNVIIRSACNIGHHTTIGDHCFIASGAVIAGKCTIESGTFVGVNATVRDNTRIAANSIVGAGALILNDTVENGVYKGLETLCSGTRRAK